MQGIAFLDEPRDGVWNMARDQALADESEATNTALLRIYSWKEPTLSLGYFQPYRLRESMPRLHRLPWVRRSTGGGAILHDQEITYSVFLPNQPGVGHATRLYESVHRGILGWLEHWNVAAQLHENSPSPARPTEDAMPAEPFLCFQRRTSKDIVIGPHKIAGSAQRRQGNLVWQHGSILWQTSAHAPEMPGIVDLEPSREWTMERRTASRKLLQCIEQATALEFSIQWRSDQIGTERVEHWIVHRFSAADWNEKR